MSSFRAFAKDPNAFLDGASADAPAVPTTLAIAKPEPTVQKLFRLRWELASALKMGAAQENAASGRRVTETEIIERLLREHSGINS